MKKRLYLKLYGLVQGVGLRWSVQSKAVALNLTGYVKNLSDGSVEIKAEGDKDDLQRIMAWLDGNPGYSQISRRKEKWTDFTNKFKNFDIIF